MFTLVLKYGNKANIPMGLLEKFDRLSKHPELINSDTYNVRSKVSPEVLALFLARVCGTESTESVTEKNADELWDLCDELGFSGFDDELRTVLGDGSSVHRRDVIALRNLVDRQNVVLEELRRRQTALERQLQMQRDLSLRVTALRAEVTELRSEVQELHVSLRRAALRDDAQELSRETGEKSSATDAKVLCVEAEQCLKTKDNDGKPTQMEMNGKAPSIEDPDEQLNGIITKLTNECGGNVCDKGIVEAIVGHPRGWRGGGKNRVANLEKDSSFRSVCDPNAFVGYDFLSKRVKPTSYTIKSGKMPQGSVHLRSWVVEVSNSGLDDSWDVVERTTMT